MNAIVYCSYTNETFKVASYIKEKIHYEMFDIFELFEFDFDNLFIVFPVHAQMVPKTIVSILKKISAKKISIFATYGKMNPGNAVYEASTYLTGNVVSGGYIPAKHAYLVNDTSFSDLSILDKYINKINTEDYVTVPKQSKNVFANISPSLRSRLSVKIKKNSACVDCNKCGDICPYISYGITSSKCFRCMKCISICPYQVLEFEVKPILKAYLNKKKINKFILF